jgi:hypothetical protein
LFLRDKKSVEKNFKRLSQESLTQNKENQTLKNFLKQLLFFCSQQKMRVVFCFAQLSPSGKNCQKKRKAKPNSFVM